MRRVLGCLLAWGALICVSASRGHAARDDEMLAQLRQQIRELEKTPAEAPGMFEKQRGERRLATLRQEVAVLEKRRLLESQERDLREVIATQPRALLREKLQAIAPDVGSTETRLREFATRRL